MLTRIDTTAAANRISADRAFVAATIRRTSQATPGGGGRAGRCHSVFSSVVALMRSGPQSTVGWKAEPAGPFRAGPAGSRRRRLLAGFPGRARLASSSSAGRLTYGTVSSTFEIVPSAR